MLLVTGITGHTGKYFLQELIKNDYKGLIRCTVRPMSDTSLLDNSGLNIDKVVGDLEDPKFIDKVMNGIQTVVHIYNIHHSPMIVRTAINNSVSRVILVHTTGVYSQFKYASKRYKEIEKEVMELNSSSDTQISITILRPSMIYGDLCDKNMSKFIKLIDKFRVIPVIDGGNSVIQPVNARDLGKAFFTVLTRPEVTGGKVYDLSGEKPIKMIDVFRLISKELNKKTIYINLPLKWGVLIARFLKVITLGKVNYTEKVQRMGEDRSYTHSNATKDFGYNPISFESGIHIEIKEYLNAR
ncbi:hypothetical protein CSV78_04080 [Sporosarcina sp. P16a]|uniref:SDR family oxidoreductase n=1 Tax=unclassified Sporosarcina TaxID=2647733 RepID=UPI000C17213F|nr:MULTISPECIES: NAD-dependent epimerase/dehydratase family protein [unclassified Sporosarcina]PIC67978.1 hypothetical protein CSV78_04080 [Sporosarcina sp. P16a]PIC94287.1 hypothetical protein CSV70_00720 [Sporosarcina sp. P25]